MEQITKNMEEFRDVKDYEGLYKVNRSGEVYSSYVNKILSRTIVNTGYYMVDLYKKGKRKKFYLHRLVAQAFLDTVEGKIQVNHKNSIRTDNHVDNLEWCNPSENVMHGYDVGNNPLGSARGTSKLNEVEVREIKEMLRNKIKHAIIAEKFKVSYVTISDIKREVSWRRVV